ncbi:hypothetical protein CPT_Moby_267 [Stenotrophomonas phage Moby]|uniref:Uncharacterized protein n=1 Tax=Stenotrophomonas phage Moby TaxID=2601680 RepID=A0A5P8PMT8_9CAUD|nr:hypothetical protein HWC58_gp131 [Stenotrophomonas phage Moby]QFR57992.1 hypothetical protein CPT_Moby_267 [Stenotrophomonas phage Moby]
MDKTKIREELELIEVIMLGYPQCSARDDVLRGLKVIRREVFENVMPRTEPADVKIFELHTGVYDVARYTLAELKTMTSPHEWNIADQLIIGGTFTDGDGDWWRRIA